MKPFTSALLIFLFASVHAYCASSPDHWDSVENWRNRPAERFGNPEANFNKAKEMILKEYFDQSITEEELYRAATQGMLNALNGRSDRKWNKLLSPTELREMEVDAKGEITGIGVEIEFTSETGLAFVKRTIQGSAAEKAGLRGGDQILSINGRLFKGLQFRDVVYAIRGKVGEKVRLRVLRGDEVISKTIVRERVQWSPVEQSWISPVVGLLVIRYFAEQTPQLTREALEEFKKNKNLRGIVIDLGENSGGLFDKAVETAELFLENGATITQTVTRNGKTETIRAKQRAALEGIPLALVVSSDTASGAELFAAALSENLGAKLVGERTLGKWNAQTLEKLDNEYAVKFTSKLFKTPKGKSYSDVGLTPDIEIAGALDAKRKAAASLL